MCRGRKSSRPHLLCAISAAQPARDDDRPHAPVAISIAVCLPIPDEAPVTIATRPC
jgi:hypothetical protein